MIKTTQRKIIIIVTSLLLFTCLALSQSESSLAVDKTPETRALSKNQRIALTALDTYDKVFTDSTNLSSSSQRLVT